MVISIPAAVAHVVSEYRRFLRTTFRFRDDGLRRQFDAYLLTRWTRRRKSTSQNK